MRIMKPTCDIQRDRVWHGKDGLSREHDMLGQTASPSTQSNDPDLITAIRPSRLARVACAIVNDRLHGDMGADFDVRDPFAYFFDGAAELMAEGDGDGFAGDGVRLGGCGDGAGKILVEVCHSYSSAFGRYPLDLPWY